MNIFSFFIISLIIVYYTGCIINAYIGYLCRKNMEAWQYILFIKCSWIGTIGFIIICIARANNRVINKIIKNNKFKED